MPIAVDFDVEALLRNRGVRYVEFLRLWKPNFWLDSELLLVRNSHLIKNRIEELPDEHPSPLGEHRVLGGCLEQTRTTRPDSKLIDPVESPTYMCNDAWHDLVTTVDIVRPQAIPGPYLLDRPLRAVGQQDWRPS